MQEIYTQQWIGESKVNKRTVLRILSIVFILIFLFLRINLNTNAVITIAPWNIYLKKTYLKTASLMAKGARAAVVLGGAKDGEIWKEVAYAYGRNVGIAFQVSPLHSVHSPFFTILPQLVDDILPLSFRARGATSVVILE